MRAWSIWAEGAADAAGAIQCCLDQRRPPAVVSADDGERPFGLVEKVHHVGHVEYAAVINTFADAGFVVERVVEARPSAEALARFPAELSAVNAAPSFIVYRLRLTR